MAAAPRSGAPPAADRTPEMRFAGQRERDRATQPRSAPPARAGVLPASASGTGRGRPATGQRERDRAGQPCDGQLPEYPSPGSRLLRADDDGLHERVADALGRHSARSATARCTRRRSYGLSGPISCGSADVLPSPPGTSPSGAARRPCRGGSRGSPRRTRSSSGRLAAERGSTICCSASSASPWRRSSSSPPSPSGRRARRRRLRRPSPGAAAPSPSSPRVTNSTMQGVQFRSFDLVGLAAAGLLHAAVRRAGAPRRTGPISRLVKSCWPIAQHVARRASRARGRSAPR